MMNRNYIFICKQYVVMHVSYPSRGTFRRWSRKSQRKVERNDQENRTADPAPPPSSPHVRSPRCHQSPRPSCVHNQQSWTSIPQVGLRAAGRLSRTAAIRAPRLSIGAGGGVGKQGSKEGRAQGGAGELH
jgi:hypothetical protein